MKSLLNNQDLFVFGLIFLFSLAVGILWVNGIDKMQKEHPDYKGEDFLNNEHDKDESEKN